MKGKPKAKGKKTNNVDDIMNNLNLGGYADEDMDDGMADFEKKFNPEQQFNIPIYDNIDKEFEKFGKAFGGNDDDIDFSSMKKSQKELSEEDKILNAILGVGGGTVKAKKKDNDMEELSKALKMAEVNLNKKHGSTNEADLLKGILGNKGNQTNNKKDDGMDELNSILSAADRNLKNKDKNDLDLVKKFLTKEEMGEVTDPGTTNKKENVTKKPENTTVQTQNTPNNEDDLYPIKQEQIFHRVNKMNSLTVLEKEIKLCQTIIEYKKKKQMDFKIWETKIEQATKQLNDIKTSVENQSMDYEAYKKTISEELAYEQKLLDVYLPKDGASTPEQKNVIEKRIKDRILIINKEINNEMDDEEEEQEEKKEPENTNESKIVNNKVEQSTTQSQNQSNEDKTQVYVDLLLQQYLSARDYFKENEFKEQEKDCIEKCKQIINAKKKIQQGNSKDVNLNDLPKSIKPEYIYGYSSEERTEKFKEILSELIKQKGQIEQKKKAYMEKLQKLNKRDLAKVKDAAKTTLDSYQSKINKYNEIIEEIKEKFKDKWVPTPEFIRQEEEEKIEKINSDIPENTVRIHIGKTDYDKDNTNLKVKLAFEGKELVKDVSLKGDKDFNETWDWQLSKGEFKALYKKTLQIDMERSYWYKFGGSNVKGSATINLKELKQNAQITGDYKLELVSKRTTPSINVTIKVRTPCLEKMYETVTKEVFNVKKIYPPFNPKSAKIPGGPTKTTPSNQDNSTTSNVTKKPVETPVSKPEPTIQQSKIEEKKNVINPEVKQEKTPETKKEPNNENNSNDNKPQKIDKSLFKDEELADVDGVDYINSLKVLEYKLKLLEKEIANISGRTPRAMMQKKIKMSCKIKMFKQQMENGDVTPQDYHGLLTQQLTHDQALFSYLKQANEIEKAKLVAIRIKLMNEEIAELKQYL